MQHTVDTPTSAGAAVLGPVDEHTLVNVAEYLKYVANVPEPVWRLQVLFAETDAT